MHLAMYNSGAVTFHMFSACLACRATKGRLSFIRTPPFLYPPIFAASETFESNLGLLRTA